MVWVAVWLVAAVLTASVVPALVAWVTGGREPAEEVTGAAGLLWPAFWLVVVVVASLRLVGLLGRVLPRWVARAGVWINMQTTNRSNEDVRPE